MLQQIRGGIRNVLGTKQEYDMSNVISVMSMTDEDLQRSLNLAYINTLKSLEVEKFLTKEQVEDLEVNYLIVIERKSWLPKFLSERFGLTKDDQLITRLVRRI